MKRCHSVCAIAIAVVFALQGAAQYTNVSPQSTNPVAVLTGVATPQISPPVLNVGQNVHIVHYTSAAGGGTIAPIIALQIDGSVDCVNYFRISDIGTNPNGGIITANGWYPCVAVELTKFAGATGAGNISATYAGTSSTTPVTNGPYNASGTSHTNLFFKQSHVGSIAANFDIPMTASAIVMFQFNTATCTGTTLNVFSTAPEMTDPVTGINGTSVATFNVASVATPQVFVIPNLVGYAGILQETDGACAGGTFSIDIFFSASTLAPNFSSYYSSAALEASAVVKALPGTVRGIAVYSTKASTQFIQCFNSATVPADTAVPLITFAVGATNNGYWTLTGGIPVAFSVGIACSNSSTAATKTIGAADTFFMVTYQ